MEIPGRKTDNIQISFSFSWAWLFTAILAIFICLKLSLSGVKPTEVWQSSASEHGQSHGQNLGFHFSHRPSLCISIYLTSTNTSRPSFQLRVEHRAGPTETSLFLLRTKQYGIRRVGKCAFYKCKSLRGVDLKSAVEIGRAAFYQCQNLESIEFGDKLETVGQSAFHGCSSLEHLKLTSIVTIEAAAFAEYTRLTDVEFSERLEAYILGL